MGSICGRRGSRDGSFRLVTCVRLFLSRSSWLTPRQILINHSFFCNQGVLQHVLTCQRKLWCQEPIYSTKFLGTLGNLHFSSVDLNFQVRLPYFKSTKTFSVGTKTRHLSDRSTRVLPVSCLKLGLCLLTKVFESDENLYERNKNWALHEI